MMTLERFRALTQSYGAELQRWPQEERGAAQELLRCSEEARALVEEERTLDEAIAAATAYQDAEGRPHGTHDAALARLRSGVNARVATREARASSRMQHLGLATSGAFAVIAGLLIGGMYTPAPESVGALSALLQPATLDILAD